jgi:hypothetical protein
MLHLRSSTVPLPLLLCAPLLAGLATAQGLPPLNLRASVNEGPFVATQQSGFGAFVQLEVTGSAASAGCWCIPVSDLRTTDPAFLAGLGAAAWQQEFGAARTAMTVTDVLGPVRVLAAPATLVQAIAAHPVDSGILMEALGPTPWLALAHADPLFQPAAGSVKLAQRIGTNLWPEWKLDAASPAPTFNVDAILQATAWRRLAGHPGLAGQTASQFFNSAAWTSVLQADPELTLTVLTLRAANVDPSLMPAAGSGLPPALRGFPNQPPRLGTTSPAKLALSFVGSSLTSGRPQFKKPGVALPVPLPTTPVGGWLQLPMVGFAPGLQVGLQRVGTTGQRLELTAVWHSFGSIRVPVPATLPSGAPTPPGQYEIAAFRYPTAVLGSSANPWQPIPAAERLIVQLL